MLSERLIKVMIVSMVGLALMGLFRPSSPDPKEDVQSAKNSFFINKAHNRNKFDMVIVGDSRALRGLAPEVIEEHLPNTRIFNMSFHAGGMNQQMFDEAEKLLLPDSSRKGIILAPTSLAFLPQKKSNSQFTEYRMKARDQVWLAQNHPSLAEFFQPVSPSVYLRKWLDLKPKKILNQEFIRTGWIATNQTPKDDVTDFSTQKEILSSYSMDQSLVEILVSQTREWTAEGIDVYCLFPPAFSPRVSYEDSILGFNPKEFRKSIELAGGHWLEVEGPNYITYDGSHLEKESSKHLSNATGLAIAKYLNQ